MQLLYRAPIGLVQTTLDGEITMINPMSAQLLMPLAPDGNLDNLFTVLAPAAPHLSALAAAALKPGEVICEGLHVALRSAAAAGGATTMLAVRLVRLDEDTLLASLSDITQSVRQQQQRLAENWHDATRIDNLTTLPNRTVVLERIDAALRTAQHDSAQPFAVLFINVDRFDSINVTRGQGAGDELLRLVAGRLNTTVRTRDAVGRARSVDGTRSSAFGSTISATDTPGQADAGPNGSGAAEAPARPENTAARLSGDEFVVLLEGLRSADDASLVAQRLCDALRRPYDLGGQPVHSSASIGVVLLEHSQADADTLLQDASLAMREAKRAGGACFRVFDPVLKERAWRRGSLEAELRRALNAEQLFVVYQPIVDMAHGGVSGMEALVRWRHPERGTVSPVEFIEIAEESGLIGALGEFVLNQACLQHAAWQRTLGDLAPSMMSVNVSRAQLSDPRITAQVSLALKSSGLPAACLQLEVTESLAAQDELIQARLRELKLLGVTLALDDFGTGYSSLSSLHLLPIDVVKIDRSFVNQVESSAHHRVLVEATVRVARSLAMSTVAEGVETPGQAAVLKALDCDKGQGYLFARPMSGDEATRWLVGAGAREAIRQCSAPDSPPDSAAMAPQPGAASLAARLLQCLEQTQIGVALFDPAERLAYANASYRQSYGDTPEQSPTWEDLMRRAHQQQRGLLIQTDDIDAWLAQTRKRYRQEPRRVFESDLVDGRWMRVTEETAADGWQLCLATDVTSLKAKEADLRQARDAAVVTSNTDPLTGLPNRRRVFECMGLLLAEAAELRLPMVAVVIDLDRFKAINDLHGHAVGDEVLVDFAITLTGGLRSRDLVGRIGGEEFLMVLMNTGADGALRVLGDLRRVVQQAARLQRWPSLRVDFSAGFAEAQPGDTVDTLWQRADAGLLQAKGAGRSREIFVPTVVPTTAAITVPTTVPTPVAITVATTAALPVAMQG